MPARTPIPRPAKRFAAPPRLTASGTGISPCTCGENPGVTIVFGLTGGLTGVLLWSPPPGGVIVPAAGWNVATTRQRLNPCSFRCSCDSSTFSTLVSLNPAFPRTRPVGVAWAAASRVKPFSIPSLKTLRFSDRSWSDM
ncbi:hypothetical protein D3C83_14510 [compost metagenome]